MRRRASLAISLATILSLLLIALAAGTTSAADRGSAADRARAEKAQHDKTVAYWTAERIANAKPRDLVKTGAGTIVPKAKPGGGSGGTSGGASYSGGGPVVQRTGKVLFTMGGGNWVCSAAVVQEPTGSVRSTHSLVLTAAHCAYDEAADEFATNWIFVPSFDTSPTFTCAQATIGCWTATGLVVHSGWANEESLTTEATKHDYAIAIVAGGGKTGTATQLDTAVGGGYPIAYPAISTGQSVHAFGYPAAGRYKGKDLTYCAGPTFNDQYNANATWGIACNMTGGSSGGPWLAGFTTAGAGTLTSVNSYGYGGLSNMYGPKFDARTQAVVTAATGRTTNYIVP